MVFVEPTGSADLYTVRPAPAFPPKTASEAETRPCSLEVVADDGVPWKTKDLDKVP